MTSCMVSPSLFVFNYIAQLCDNLQDVKEKIKPLFHCFHTSKYFANMNHSSLCSKLFIASVTLALPGLGGNKLPFFNWSKAISNLAPANHAKNNLFESVSNLQRTEEYVYHETRNHQ